MDYLRNGVFLVIAVPGSREDGRPTFMLKMLSESATLLLSYLHMGMIQSNNDDF